MAATIPVVSRTSQSDGSKHKHSSSDEAQTTSDSDAARLADMGYTQELDRGFSLFSVLGSAFSLTNSWFGLSSAMITGISAGGPVLLIYGIIIIALISTCTAVTLGELASAIPNAGGQYFWASQLASRRYARIASFFTGWFAYAGSIFTSASVALALSLEIVGMYQLTHPTFVIEAWHIVITYELFIYVCYFFNVYGKALPTIAQFTFAVSLLSFAIIIITVPIMAPTHQTVKFVFATFMNSTGWKQPGIAFITGLINPNWAFGCLDAATHLAEEVPRPERIVPIVIMLTVPIGFVTGWFFVMAMMFCIQDLSAIKATPTGVPILEIFHEAVNTAGAIGLTTLVVLTGTGSLIACQTWQARICWSFSRDRGLPGHQWLKAVNRRLDTPLAAHTASCIINALVGLLYLGSSAAFNSMVTATIVLLYLSYAIPVLCLLIRGRNNIQHGPFWLGRFGFFANCILLAWTAFTLVMYSFPVTIPVTTGNMNYVSAVYGVVVMIISIDWFVRGKREFNNIAVQIRRSVSHASTRRRSFGRVDSQSPEHQPLLG